MAAARKLSSVLEVIAMSFWRAKQCFEDAQRFLNPQSDPVVWDICVGLIELAEGLMQLESAFQQIQQMPQQLQQAMWLLQEIRNRVK